MQMLVPTQKVHDRKIAYQISQIVKRKLKRNIQICFGVELSIHRGDRHDLTCDVLLEQSSKIKSYTKLSCQRHDQLKMVSHSENSSLFLERVQVSSWAERSSSDKNRHMTTICILLMSAIFVL